LGIGHAAAILAIVIGLCAISDHVQYASGKAQDFEDYQELDFGIMMQRPVGWIIEGDNVWFHSDINPWHLPLIPIGKHRQTLQKLPGLQRLR
jgi:hypothetical protein